MIPLDSALCCRYDLTCTNVLSVASTTSALFQRECQPHVATSPMYERIPFMKIEAPIVRVGKSGAQAWQRLVLGFLGAKHRRRADVVHRLHGIWIGSMDVATKWR